VVYAFFKVFESFADVIVSWIPFYFFIKCIFLIWCYYPGTKGATIVYKKFMRPYLVKAMMELGDSIDGEESEMKASGSTLTFTVIRGENLRMMSGEEEVNVFYVATLSPTTTRSKEPAEVNRIRMNSFHYYRSFIISLFVCDVGCRKCV